MARRNEAKNPNVFKYVDGFFQIFDFNSRKKPLIFFNELECHNDTEPKGNEFQMGDFHAFN